MAEKVGFDAFYLQNTAVEKFHPHYFVGESLDFGLFQQSPSGQFRKIIFLENYIFLFSILLPVGGFAQTRK
jgi:hypothetical protein